MIPFSEFENDIILEKNSTPGGVKRFNLFISTELYKKLHAEAKVAGRTAPNWIKEAVADYINRKSS